MTIKEEFVRHAKEGKILVKKCSGCGHLHLVTVYFCQKCGAQEFEDAILEGRGTVATYTIITVPPAGFEEYVPYAWVVLALEGSDLRISGFMAGISSPADLPVGTAARITGFDKRGILLETVK